MSAQEREDAALGAGCGAFIATLINRAILITAVIIGVLDRGPLAGVMWSIAATLTITSASLQANHAYKTRRNPPPLRPTPTKPNLN